MKIVDDARGQGSVEAAFAIPVLFMLMLMLMQPGIVLYDYIVMKGAAAEACRLVATVEPSGSGAASCEDFIKHRLASIPQHDLFHVHDGACSWSIRLEGGESAGMAAVSIDNELKPLPLLDVGMKLLGATNEAGNLKISVTSSGAEQPDWLLASVEGSPSEWVGAW